MTEFHAPLVSAQTVLEYLGRPDWVVFDCRFDLADKEKGLREYGKGHIPGAFYAHIERDLSGPVGTGGKGRHPLPIPAAFSRWCATNGITPTTQVVCYDDAAGQWASRLWWLLRHYGFPHVAVLDGGLARWKALRLPLRAQHEKSRNTVPTTAKPGSMPTVGAEDIANPKAPLVLVDARAPERYRGEVEPIDKQAGHIPGAINMAFAANVASDMRFLSPDELRAKFIAAGVPETITPTTEAAPAPQAAPVPEPPEPEGPTASELARTMTRDQRKAATAVRAPRPAAVAPVVSQARVACYCGSGVTSTQAILAMELAGLGTPALYPGSWSEWAWPEAKRPIETGARQPAA